MAPILCYITVIRSLSLTHTHQQKPWRHLTFSVLWTPMHAIIRAGLLFL